MGAGWEGRPTTEADLREWFGHGSDFNVCIQWGSASANLVDVDLDCTSAVAVADLLLPGTGWLFGRPKHPQSHRVYKVDSVGKTIKLKDPALEKTAAKKATVIELRGENHQTVVPPSKHEVTGETIEWVTFTEPATVAYDSLARGVYTVAAAALLARHCWSEGSRHDVALALGGALAHDGYSLDGARRLAEAVARAVGDDDVGDRVRAVEDSYAKLVRGESLTGWPELKRILGEEKGPVLERVRAWLRPPGTGGPPPHFTDPPRPLPTPLLPVPRLHPAMLPEPFREWLWDIAERGCFPLEFPAAAIVAAAAVVGRRLGIRPKRCDDWLVVPNLWGAIVGPPSVQKTPGAEEALLPLKRLVAEALAAYEAALEEYKLDSLVAKAQAKAAKDALEKAAKGKRPKAGKGDATKAEAGDAEPAGDDKDELRLLAQEALAGEGDKPPVLRRYIVNDSTVEKLGEILAENPNGVLTFRDELTGFLRTLDREGHENDRGFYLEGWNGTGDYTYDRIGRGTLHTTLTSVFPSSAPSSRDRWPGTSALPCRTTTA
jgi:hypothetical protein